MKAPIALTVGMGIGPEICIKALPQFTHPTVLLSRKGMLLKTLAQMDQEWDVLWSNPLVNIVEVDDNLVGDQIEPAEVHAIRLAVEGCLNGSYGSLVTGPIHKAKLMDQGFAFAGHTEFLGELCSVANPVMAFRGGNLQVLLITTHLPILEVPKSLSISDIVQKVWTAETTYASLGQKPRFAICGLNPHAGENGKLGREEIEIIAPACEILERKGVSLVGPVSAETAFLMAKNGEVDIVVAMYHDQGLAPLKLVDFGRSVNWTLGLPIIRTSVDHGTADALVGKNCADESSLMAAWHFALELMEKRA